MLNLPKGPFPRKGKCVHAFVEVSLKANSPRTGTPEKMGEIIKINLEENLELPINGLQKRVGQYPLLAKCHLC